VPSDASWKNPARVVGGIAVRELDREVARALHGDVELVVGLL
jgi:hypothetical protein